MKVKEFFKKYANYSIELYGRPLENLTIPFTHLPRDKKLEECDVIDYVVEEKEHKVHHYNLREQKWSKTETRKGYARAYVK